MKHLDLLGHQVTDRVTGFSGVVEGISYDLYGCIQPYVRPPVDEKGKLESGRHFDAGRLTKSGSGPVVCRLFSFDDAAERVAMLGYHASDVVTNFQGVIEAVHFDLSGRIDFALRKTVEDSHWFHVSRVTRTASMPRAMAPPLSFEEDKGAAEKPAR